MFPAVIASIAILLGFIVLGLGVVFLAFGGGASGAREQLHSQTRIGRRVSFIGTGLVTLLFGVGLPALLLDNNASSQSKSAPGGVDLTKSQEEGRELFVRNCATCHTLNAAKAVGKVGPDLDAMRPPAELTINAIEEGRARGQGQMPSELVDSEDAKKVASFIAATAGR
jgi:mono/diheme cytochrome c family protein